MAVHAPVDYRDTTSGASGKACIDGLLWPKRSPIELGSATNGGRTCMNALSATWTSAWCRPEWGHMRRASALRVRGRMDGQVAAPRLGSRPGRGTSPRLALVRAPGRAKFAPVRPRAKSALGPRRVAARGRGRARSRIRCPSSLPVTDRCHDLRPRRWHDTGGRPGLPASERAAPMVDAVDVLRHAVRSHARWPLRRRLRPRRRSLR